MNQSRRKFVVRSLLLSLAYPLYLYAQQSDQPGIPQSNDATGEAKGDAEFEQAFASLRQKAIDFYSGLGYQPIDRKALLTGHAFNGGLRYDESGTASTGSERSMIIQDCARIGDIGEQHRHDILPYFHILGCNARSRNDDAQIVKEILDFLLGPVGLAPQRLAFVSVERLSTYRQLLAEHGIDWQRQVVIRDTDAAKAVGDGSGHFRPAGHPEQPDQPSVGIYAWLGEGPVPAVHSYPLPAQWSELGEIGLGPDSESIHGVGLERLVYATTGLLPSWHDRREHLLARIEAEVAASGGSLPEGYYLFKG